MNIEQGVILAVLTHAGATIWWASKTSAMLSNVISELKSLNTKMDKEDGKLDLKIEAAHRRIDEERDRITRLEISKGGY